MKIFLECLPCMLRQVFEASCIATCDEEVRAVIMDEALEALSGYRSYSCAPKMCEVMHAIIIKNTGVRDPYAKIKEQDIADALSLESVIREYIFNSGNSLLKALKASATGNIMDSAIYKDMDIKKCLIDELEMKFAVCDIQSFEKDCIGAKHILIIGDNAGETVFDKMLAENLSKEHQIIYAVRGEPIINDVTVADAYKTGIQDYATIISTGCAAPGAVLESCNAEFRALFDSVDVVISKGQGNFEALSDSTRKIYFLLKAKCPQIAKTLDVELNDYVLFRESNANKSKNPS